MGPIGVVAAEETVLRAQIGDDGNALVGFRAGVMIDRPGLPSFKATAGWANLGTGDVYLQGNRLGIIPIKAHGNLQALRFSWKAGWGPLSRNGVVEFTKTFDKDQ